MTQHKRQPSCSTVLESIEAYLDRSLDPNDMTTVENHIEHCARCRQELHVAQTVDNELRNLAMMECPDHVTERVFAAVRQADGEAPVSPRSSNSLRRWFTGHRFGRPILAGSMAAIIVITAVVFIRVDKPTEEISQSQIEEAEAAIKWTFAYVNQVSRRSGLAVRDQVFEAGVMQPMERAVRTAVGVGTTTPEKEDGGSI